MIINANCFLYHSPHSLWAPDFKEKQARDSYSLSYMSIPWLEKMKTSCLTIPCLHALRKGQPSQCESGAPFQRKGKWIFGKHNQQMSTAWLKNTDYMKRANVPTVLRLHAWWEIIYFFLSKIFCQDEPFLEIIKGGTQMKLAFICMRMWLESIW